MAVPTNISYNDIFSKKSFSPNEYKTLFIKNKNVKKVSELFSEEPQKGEEVGSFSYINKSKVFFLRAKTLQENSFLPNLDDLECAVPILPHTFVDSDLRKGDILLSKDSNVGEVVILDRNLPNYMLGGAIFRLKFEKDKLYYIFAFLKSQFFKSQINIMIARGATIKHAGTVWLDAIIPFPNSKNADDIINFIGLLTQATIRKESEIKSKYRKIITIIDDEINDNQLSTKFQYSNPSLNDIRSNSRIDAGLFCQSYKESQFKISNYRLGFNTISQSDFDYKRGQNLQISQIGSSIYTYEYKPNFYKLIRPVSLSYYGTVEQCEYLGNRNELQKLNKGEIIFSAEGTIGKFVVMVEPEVKTITNIHGITFYPKREVDITESIFFGLFLGYLRDKGILDYISVGGQGGSLSGKWNDHIRIPKFGDGKKKELATLYYKDSNYEEERLNLTNFEEKDIEITKSSGIWQLDAQVKKLKQEINRLIDMIIADQPILPDFSFLYSA
jgi:type I restriction enzyme S subunit